MSERLQQFESKTEVGIGAATAGVSGLGPANEYGSDVIHRTEIPISALSIAVTDSGGVNGGFGGQKVYDFPVGLIQILAATSKLSAIARNSTGIVATATVKHSLGSAVEATNDTLDSTQADVIPSTNAVLVAGAGSATGKSTAGVTLDGVSAAKSLYLNIGVADAGITATDGVTVTGTIVILWTNAKGN